MNDIKRNGIRWIKRTAVAVVGTMILLAGIIMIFLPGPGMIIIPAGLGILATEFTWAKTLLSKLRVKVEKIVTKSRKKTGD